MGVKPGMDYGGLMASESLDEPLLLNSIAYKGYLKFPRAFTERFDFLAKSLPNPKASIERSGGRVRLTYEWTETQLEEAARDAASSRAKDAKSRKRASKA